MRSAIKTSSYTARLLTVQRRRNNHQHQVDLTRTLRRPSIHTHSLGFSCFAAHLSLWTRHYFVSQSKSGRKSFPSSSTRLLHRMLVPLNILRTQSLGRVSDEIYDSYAKLGTPLPTMRFA